LYPNALPLRSKFATVNNYTMNILGTVAFVVVMLHLLVGFGYVAYKLKPPKNHK
jgi:hypothetical protein